VVGDGDLPGYTAVRTVSRTTSRCFGFSGLATRCFGAWTVMVGRVVPPEGVWLCDIAVPPRPHSSRTIDKTATAGLKKNRDENPLSLPMVLPLVLLKNGIF
jgi:hypothetical protein